MNPSSLTSLPVPPEHLRMRVSGSSDPELFLVLGARIAADLRRALSVAGVELGTSGQTVLDFGCGSGRVLRHFTAEAAAARFIGVDVDPEAIEWCTTHLPGLGTFHSTDRRPPLPLRDNSIDVAYGVSVFTHLQESDQAAWLTELRRVLRPGGTALLSLYGPRIVAAVAPDFSELIRSRGVVYVHDGGTYGLPDWYQTCFHDRAHVEKTWPDYLELVAYLSAAVAFSQDVVVLRKPQPT
jgi:SAM-dependent methyltransferase